MVSRMVQCVQQDTEQHSEESQLNLKLKLSIELGNIINIWSSAFDNDVVTTPYGTLARS